MDYLLVGDSLGMLLYGDAGTHHMSPEEMCRHVLAVKRGVDLSSSSRKPEIVGDMVAGSYTEPTVAAHWAKRMTEAGAQMLKLEGPCLEVIRALKAEGYRICGHIGLTPQSIHNFKLQGRSEEAAKRLRQEAKDIEAAGAELLVLEMIPASLAQEISAALTIPTIGIGAGPYCGGQVLVIYDLLGLNPEFKPRFLKTYENLYDRVQASVQHYATEVRDGQYPQKEHYYT